jgi:hypothetical protein
MIMGVWEVFLKSSESEENTECFLCKPTAVLDIGDFEMA